ncbi:MAG: SLBB domain-containing protein [Lentisphaeraceae bacterium]|nr:SLBB domain-containing protein [Lentisphaeraceae bacterium]
MIRSLLIQVLLFMSLQVQGQLAKNGQVQEGKLAQLVTPAGAEQYKLNIGDSLIIADYGKPASQKVVTVDNYGFINYYVVGNYKAYGKTIPVIKEELSRAFQKFTRFTEIMVMPYGAQSQNFIMSGNINEPGRKALNSDLKLLDAIADAGGLTQGQSILSSQGAYDLKRSFLIRDYKLVKVNFERLIEEGDISQNIKIESGDFIHIADKLNQKIYILGEVRSPSHFEVVRQSTFLQVISHARGLTQDASDEVLIIRGSLTNPKVLRLSYKEIKGGLQPDVFLKPDDVVYVPPRSMLFGEELLERAINTIVNRVASETGFEAFKLIKPDFDRSSEDSLFGQ